MNILISSIKSFIYLFFCCFYFSTSMAISSDWDESETSKLRLISPFSENNQKHLLIGLEYKMQPGWKTYWKSPGDGGFPQVISGRIRQILKN